METLEKAFDLVIKDAKDFAKNLKDYHFPNVNEFADKLTYFTAAYEGELLKTYLKSLSDEISELIRIHTPTCPKSGNCFYEQSHLKYQLIANQRLSQLIDSRVEEVKIRFEADSFFEFLHPRLSEKSKSLFENGHFAESIRAAYIELVQIIKMEYKSETAKTSDGTPLMMAAFHEDQPVFLLEDPASEFYRDIQGGYKFLFAGAVMAVRNPKAHSNDEIDQVNAIEKLFLASMLLKKFESRIK